MIQLLFSAWNGALPGAYVSNNYRYQTLKFHWSWSWNVWNISFTLTGSHWVSSTRGGWSLSNLKNENSLCTSGWIRLFSWKENRGQFPHFLSVFFQKCKKFSPFLPQSVSLCGDFYVFFFYFIFVFVIYPLRLNSDWCLESPKLLC